MNSMKQLKPWLFFLFSVGFLLVMSSSSPFAAEPWIRVGIGVFQEVQLEAPQGINISFPNGKSMVKGSARFSVARQNAISINGSPSEFSSVLVVSRGGFIKFNGRPYRGHFKLYALPSGIKVINLVNLEDYIKGTIKLEINPDWPREAILSYIITVRTYVISNLGRHDGEGFDLCASSHCVLYGGVNAESPVTNSLVEESKGLIVTYQGKPAQVLFHSESGGVTESAWGVWGKHVPYLVSVTSPWEKDAPHAHWRVSFTLGELQERLLEKGLIEGRLQSLSFEYGENGRAREVKAFTDQGIFAFTAYRFREAVGFKELPSTFFKVSVERCKPQSVRDVRPLVKRTGDLKRYRDVERKNVEELLQKDWTLDDIIAYLKERERLRENSSFDQNDSVTEAVRDFGVNVDEEVSYVFEGSGYGHGVGLSQWGARGMALQGYNSFQILKHYFPGCEIGRAIFR